MDGVTSYSKIVACADILQSYDGHSLSHTRYDKFYNIHKHENSYKLSILNQILFLQLILNIGSPSLSTIMLALPKI